MQSKGNKTHKTALVVIPPEELWPPIQAIRRQHDRQIRRWMPHITMLYPFRPQEEFAPLAEQFLEICEHIEPFTIELAAFRYFHHKRESYTLWLVPEPEETLVQLQTMLWEVVPDCDDVRKHKGGFTPHLSVGQVRGKAKMVQLQNALQAAWQPLSFVVRKVSLIWHGQPPDDVFSIGQEVRLGLESQ
jgi:2'-5' RNA ligase